MPFEPQTTLGRTGLKVGRLGVGSSYGVGMEGLEAALDRGQNLFYWGSLRRGGFGRAVRELARRDRDKIVFLIQTFWRYAWPIGPSIEWGLKRAGLDYADVLVLGLSPGVPSEKVIEAALKLKERGRVRYLGISSHNRPMFRKYLEMGIFDLFMVRYNAAHRGAESDVFDHLPEENAPGILAYTCTRWGHLLNPKRMPPGEKTPRATDCYRFALSHPKVDVAITGPKNAEQMRENLGTLDEGPLGEGEHAWMSRVGDHIHANYNQRYR